MGKAAAKKKMTTTPAQDELDQYMSSVNAKQQFIGATMNMGWRLAITVVIPIVIGVKADERFDSSPSYTLTGMIIAATAGCMAVWGTIKEVNREQIEYEKETKKRAK